MVRRANVGRVIVLVLAGAVAAAVSNLAAPTARKLAWIGAYPRALEVGPAAEAAVTPRPAAVPTAGASPSAPTTAPGSPAPSEAPAPLSPELAKSFPPHPDKPAIEISPADVELLYRGKVLFLDARRSSVYAESHIAGARSVPVWESDIDARVKALYEEGLNQRAPIVAYCSGGNCEDSHMLAEKLYMVGFDNVLIYKDGFPDWQKRGLPVARGTSP